MRKFCRICSSKILNILDFKKVALSGNFLTKKEILNEKKYPLNVGVCISCKHLQIQNIIKPDKLFSHYDWETGVSLTNLNLIADLLKELKKKFKLDYRSKLIEIASNDGSLLSLANQIYKCSVLGVDPAKNLAKKIKKKKIDTIVNFFSNILAKKILKKYNTFDFCIARNVIAHTPNPNDIFKGVHNILNDQGIFVIEVPHLINIFFDNQYDNIFHEHIGFHSLKSIIDLSNRNNLKVINVKKIDSQGGSIRCFISKKNSQYKIDNTVLNLLKKEKKMGLFKTKSWKLFAKNVNDHSKNLYNFLKKIKLKNKNISAYGASGKGQSLLQLSKIGKFIDYVYDKSNLKIGKYTPGTHIKILNPKKINKTNTDYLLLLSWNLYKEIAKQENSFIKKGGRFILPFPKPYIYY
jgi:SAM-dependent methyltransferase